MNIKITDLNKLEVSESESEIDKRCDIKDSVKLKVTHCAICKTDAKIWNEGHRDLHLPRILGHEIVAELDNKIYAIWPGIVCEECSYCKNGSENLCDNIKILGFHEDGGFADSITVPKSSLIKVPKNLSSEITTFAEPTGCAINALEKLNIKKGERILIYGAGTVGLILALFSKEFGAIPTIIEKSEIKISKAYNFLLNTDIKLFKETNESKFDCVINACPEIMAFSGGISKLAKGGRFIHFSGITKNMKIESNLINLLHYRENIFIGSYGLTRSNMKKGINLIKKYSKEFEMLIESIISPYEVEEVMPNILAGISYKYIINFNQILPQNKKELYKMENITKNLSSQNDIKKNNYLNLASKISEPSKELYDKAQNKINFKTKPLGALGTLEDLAIKMSLIQETLMPTINTKALFVFAADHGIAEEGVSAFPQEVTQQMVQNFLNGGAAINVLCRHNNIDISIIDIGVAGLEINDNNLISKRVSDGTKNFALTKAMTLSEAEMALNTGANIFTKSNKINKINILGLGEMGIANTTSATAIISTITELSVSKCTGRGTGVDDRGLEHKIEVLEKALKFHKPNKEDALDILSKVGGFEIAGIAGAALAAAASGTAVVLDGLISTAAGLIAYIIEPKVANYFISGHKSVEIGHIAALDFMGIKPVLDLGFRLGEGTGAALTIDIVDNACDIMRDMASFEEAGVSGKE